MAEEFEFQVDGLEEMEKALSKVIEKAPVQAEKTLLSIARSFKRDAKKTTGEKIGTHERKAGEEKKAINQNWGHKKVGDNIGTAVLIYNKARHFHLIENGHNLVKNGRNVGFVPGKHIMEDTREKYREIVPKKFEKMIDDILKEGDLN